MKRNLIILVTAALAGGVLLAPTADAGALPVVPDGFRAEVFAYVTDPVNMSFDSGGYMYVGRDAWFTPGGGNHGTAVPIHRISPDGSTVVEFGDPIPDPDAVIVDITGTVAGQDFVLVGGSAGAVGGPKCRITQIAPDGTTSVLVQSSLREYAQLQDFAFDASGRLLFVCPDGDAIGTIDDGALKVFANLPAPGHWVGIAASPEGRIFAADNLGNTIAIVDSAGTVVNPSFVSDLPSPYYMAFDATGLFGGGLFVGISDTVVRVDPDTGHHSQFATGFASSGINLTFGPDGYLYVGEIDSDRICRIYPTGFEAVIDLDPDTLNLKGKWITCYVQLPEEYDVGDIDVGSIFLEGLLQAQHSDVQDGVLMVKFDRQEVISLLLLILEVLELDPPADVALKVTGMMADGTPFEGIDIVTVIDKGKGKK